MLDLRQFTYEAARYRRNELDIPVVVVTGSAGKTSVKELTGAILAAVWGDKCFMSPANKNTKIALASQVLTMPLATKVAVFEMGARRRHDFEIPLSYLRPSVVVLLNLGTAHVGEFGSIENLRTEKLSALRTPTAEVLVISGDDKLILNEGLRTQKKIFTFGRSDHCQIQLLEESSESVLLRVAGSECRFACSWESSEKGLNIAAAVAICQALGVPSDAIQKALRTFKGVPRRFEILKWNGVTAIDDAFNASPESMMIGLRKVRGLYSDKKILLVLGSMLELGENCRSAHCAVANLIWQLFGDELKQGRVQVITVGNEAALILEQLQALGLRRTGETFKTVEEARAPILSRVQEFEILYLKGAKAVQLQKILN